MQIKPSCVGCPAAELIKGNSAVRCRVEGVNIESEGHLADVNSLKAFCTGDYTKCPSWRQHKKTGLTQAENATITKHREYLAALADEDLLGEFEERAGKF